MFEWLIRHKTESSLGSEIETSYGFSFDAESKRFDQLHSQPLRSHTQSFRTLGQLWKSPLCPAKYSNGNIWEVGFPNFFGVES